MSNLYVHFPFCRRKCAYCALPSRAGADEATRKAYVAERVVEMAERHARFPEERWDTVYFGGGTPALCDLQPLLAALRPQLAKDCEFTVELHPCDVTDALLARLAAGGVNRISLGIQSFDDGVLQAMGRLHTADEAEAAFCRIRDVIPNAGFDLIAGYPAASGAAAFRRTLARAAALAPVHVSCYTLIREPATRIDRDVRRGALTLPSDDAALAEFDAACAAFASVGLERYEISNFAKPGFACRHNAAVWAGEDYVGLGEGACGREGPVRRAGNGTVTAVTPREDALERTIFALRTRRGLDLEDVRRRFPILSACLPDWDGVFARNVRDGLVVRVPGRAQAYRLTKRGTEVCDAILSDLLDACCDPGDALR